MALFLGKFQYVIDDKGRVNIPARFRDQLAKEPDMTLAMFKGLDGCVFVYPPSTLERFRDNFSGSQFQSEEMARLFERLMADGGSISTPDSQGRVTLTDEQREHAGLVRDVVLFGNWNRIEIWDPKRLDAHLAKGKAKNQGLESLAGRFFGSGGKIGKES